MSGSKWEKRFMFDLASNSTPVPNLLLRYYQQLGLTENELIFLIQLLMVGEKGCHSIRQISEILGLDTFLVKETLASLIEKGFIVPESIMDSGSTRVPRYFFDGLYDKLIDLWACEMVGNREAATGGAGDTGLLPARNRFGYIYEAIEKEFGRPLSPMESEKIIEWLDKEKYRPEMVLESLKRAVLRGVFNLNYVDRILLEWQKANVRTLHEALNYENQKMKREKPGRKKPVVSRNHKLKSLYEI